jgi:hypothetical protein
MPIDCVIAEIGFASDEPFGKGRVTEITNRMEWSLPMNRFRLFGPEAFTLFQRVATELDRSSGRTHWGALSNCHQSSMSSPVRSSGVTGVQELQNSKLRIRRLEWKTENRIEELEQERETNLRLQSEGVTLPQGLKSSDSCILYSVFPNPHPRRATGLSRILQLLNSCNS